MNAESAAQEGEEFGPLCLRRGRYLLAVLVSAGIFLTAGWPMVAPLPLQQGASLTLWSSHGGLLPALVLLGLLLVTTLISQILTWPDAPHTGLFCATLGLASLAIRGGDVSFLIRENQLTQQPPLPASLLWECVWWVLILAVTEVISQHLFQRYFANTRWMARYGLKPQRLGEINTPGKSPLLTQAAALVMTGAIALLFTFIFLQSQAKAQVLMATALSFGLGAFLAHQAFPQAKAGWIFLAVPLTAALGYLLSDASVIYPGQASWAQGRALPLDYLSTGTAGAIWGYYASLRMHLQEAAA